MLVRETDKDIAITQSNLGKFIIFIQILYITKEKGVFIQCCMVKIIQIFNFSTQGIFEQKMGGG